MSEASAGETSEPIAEALWGFMKVQHGRAVAVEAALDALIGTLLTSLPPLAESLLENLASSASAHRPILEDADVDPETLRAFDVKIEQLQAGIKMLSGQG